jgi:hypothetical protein
MKMKKLMLPLAISALAMPALALEPMPKQDGFSGSLGLGAAGGSVESNFLAKVIGVDLGNEDIYVYDSPSQTDIIIPSFEFDLGYTFGNQKSRIYLTNVLEDPLDFSSNTALAFRHDFASLGNIELAGLAPGAAQTEVWENPYELGVDRDATERSTSGGRLTWDKMFGTGLEFVADIRKVDIDEERSGQNLGLTAAQQDLLDREGDVSRYSLGYTFNCADDVQVQPSVAYIDRDLDGKAMAQDGYELGVDLVYSPGAYTWVNSVVYQSLDGDKENPLFNEVNDANVYRLASELNIPNPMGWDQWFATVGFVWGENQADIDFNKSSVALFSARVGRNF